MQRARVTSLMEVCLNQKIHCQIFNDGKEKNDAMVKVWLKNSLGKEIQETAHDIWNDLCERYGQSNVPHLYKIRKKFSNLV